MEGLPDTPVSHVLLGLGRCIAWPKAERFAEHYFCNLGYPGIAESEVLENKL